MSRMALLWACLTPPFAVLFSSAAHAQVIDQYFPPIGSGVGSSAAEVSLATALRAYNPPGILFHDFAIRGDAGESVGFDSNVDGLPGGAQSPVFDTSAALSADSQWSRHEVNAAATVDDTRYPSRSAQDHTNWTANLGGVYDFGHDKLGASYTHLSLVQLPSELGALATNQRIAYQVDEAALSYTATTGSPLSLIPGADITHYQFQNNDGIVEAGPPGGAGTIAGSQSYRNRIVVDETLTARYGLSQDNGLLVVARGTQIQYQQKLAGIPSRNSNGIAIMAGADLRDNGPIEFRALVGYQERSYRSGGYSTIRSPIAQAEFAWLPNRLTTVSATITNGIDDSAFENVVGFTATSATLRVQHEYQRNVTLGAYVNVQQASYPSTPQALVGTVLTQEQSNQTAYGGGLDLRWLINRHLRLNATYDISNQNAVTGQRFTTNEMLLSLHLVL